MTLAEKLAARGLVNQHTGESLAEVLDGPRRKVYHGIDPTADSIHAGNFAVFMLLRHLVQAGHEVTLLIGGGTGMIGDPKPDVERPLTPPNEVAARAEKLKQQAEHLLGGSVTIVNNYDWLGSIDLITLTRRFGHYFSTRDRQALHGQRATQERGDRDPALRCRRALVHRVCLPTLTSVRLS